MVKGTGLDVAGRQKVVNPVNAAGAPDIPVNSPADSLNLSIGSNFYRRAGSESVTFNALFFQHQGCLQFLPASLFVMGIADDVSEAEAGEQLGGITVIGGGPAYPPVRQHNGAGGDAEERFALAVKPGKEVNHIFFF